MLHFMESLTFILQCFPELKLSLAIVQPFFDDHLTCDREPGRKKSSSMISPPSGNPTDVAQGPVI